MLVRYHVDQNKAAMDELVCSHMPIIFRVASRSAQNPGVDINDLIQTATEGLLIAINRWSFEKSDASGARYASELSLDAPQAAAASDEAAEPPVVPTHSTRLATYALWWMRIMLTNSVIDNRGIVVRAKSPKVRKALFSLPAAIRKLNIALPLSGADVSRISTFLCIDEQYIEEALIHAAGDVMLDEPIGDGGMLRGGIIADQNAEGEHAILHRLGTIDSWDAICTGLMELSPRDRFILITRYLLMPKWKLDRLSETLKMSRERIRQIGCDGLARIRTKVGPDGARHNPICNDAVAAVESLVSQIEAAATDPALIAAFLRSQMIAIGSTRTVDGTRRGRGASADVAMLLT